MRCLARVRAQPLHRLVKPAAVEADRTRTSDHPCSWALALLTSRSGLPSLVNGGKRYAALSSDQGGLSGGTPMESTRVGYSCIGSFPPPGRQRYAAYTLRIVFSGSGLLGPFGCSASEQPCRVELFTPRITAGSPVFVPPGLGSPAPRFVFCCLRNIALRWSWGFIPSPLPHSPAPPLMAGEALCQSRNKFQSEHCPLAVGNSAWYVATGQACLPAPRGPPGALFTSCKAVTRTRPACEQSSFRSVLLVFPIVRDWHFPPLCRFP